MATFPEFRGKVALVTGAGRVEGLGFATAKRFALEGADVAIVDIGSRGSVAGVDVASGDQLNATEAELRKLAPASRIVALACDQRDPEQVKHAAFRVREKFGRVDFLANIASICPITLAPNIDLDVWDQTMDVNARGAFVFSQEVAKVMVEQGWGGRIVNVASPAAKMIGGGVSVYAASKAAVLAITRCLARDLARHRILVNSICPGAMQGTFMGQQAAEDMARAFRTKSEKFLSGTVAQVPLGRAQTTDEAASVIVFLCSDEATYITGTNINVDGGVCPY